MSYYPVCILLICKNQLTTIWVWGLRGCESCNHAKNQFYFVNKFIDFERRQVHNHLHLFAADKIKAEDARQESVKLRETGNLLYKSRRFADAIAAYSEAAVEASKVPDVAIVSAAIANRSAALFEAGSFAEAEEDAAATLDIYGYPQPQV